jgi:sulfur carrier protein
MSTTRALVVNGTPATLTGGTTVADVVARCCPDPRGVAVARNGEVVPRSLWAEEQVADGDHIEIVGAAAGG